MTLAACQKSENEAPIHEDGLYTYRFSINEDTKAIIGDNNIEWVSGDRVGMYVGDYTGYANIDMTTTPKSVIIYSRSAIAAGTLAYAYAPYDGTNSDVTYTKVAVSPIQQGSTVSAMPLAGIPFEVVDGLEIPDGSTSASTNGEIQFFNLGSLINFKIYSTDEALQSETIKSVKFEANEVIAGDAYIDLSCVDAEDETTLELVVDGNESTTVTVNEEVAIAAAKADATPVKMVILPGTFEGTLTITTDVATYTKTIPSREFVRSHSRTFGIDLAGAERTEGVEEVVVNLPYSEAFTSNQGQFEIDNVVLPEGQTNLWSFDASYGAKVTAYIGGQNLASESWLVSPWMDLTEVAGAKVTFSHAGRYFTDINTAKNECTFWAKSDEEGADWEQLTIDNYFTNTSWTYVDATVSLNDFVGKKVKVAFKYTSTSTKAGTWEIKNFSAVATKADPELAYGDGSIVVEATVSDTTIDAPELTNPHDLTVSYASSNEEVANVDNAGNVTLLGVVGTATITASFAGNDNYEAGEASYKIKVSNPSSTVPDPETIVFAEWTPALENSVQYTDPFDGGNFTIAFAGGANDGKYYTTGTGIRTYGGGTITIASTEYTIAKIEFTWSGTYKPEADVADPEGYSTETCAWTGEANTIVLTRPTGSGHWRLQAVTVTYAN